VQGDIYDALMRDEDTRKSSYSVVVKLWLGTAGEVQRVELEGSSGDVRIDESIKRAVSGLSRVAEAPPAICRSRSSCVSPRAFNFNPRVKVIP